jgi:hypothetical protein
MRALDTAYTDPLKKQLASELLAACPNGGCFRAPRVNGRKIPWCVHCRASVTVVKQAERVEGWKATLKSLNKRCQMVEAAAGANAFSQEGRRIAKYLHDQIRELRAELLQHRRKQYAQERETRLDFERMAARAKAQIDEGRGGIYVIQCGGLIKIGISVDVHARVKGLDMAQNSKITPLAFIREDDRERQLRLEGSLHYRFAEHHHRGEWFRDCEEIRAFIAAEAGPWPEKKKASVA